MAYTIRIHNTGKTISAQKGDLLADMILESGIDLSLYCQKKALCGKCFIEVLDGDLPPPDDQEDLLIRKNKKGRNHRLACQYKIAGNMVINIPQESLIQKTDILRTGIKLPLTIDPSVKKYYMELAKPELGRPHSLLSELRKHLRKKNLDVSPSLLRTYPGILEENRFKATAVLYGEKQVLAIESGDKTGKSFGLAVDLGTSTLVVELVDLITGAIIEAETANNSQMKFGMDIVSRISYAYDSPVNLAKLQTAICETLSQMIKRILNRSEISPDHVYDVVIAGNTTMNHLLLGVPVDTLAISPFHAVFHDLPHFAASELGLPINPNARAYVVPNIQSFVGGDITAGLQATDMANLRGNHLLLDLGTNGEIVLKTEKKFVATSTAAGPAFEGMNIGSGMLALPGAIYKAEHKKRLIFRTIGGKKPLGICGTGLIDLIAIFLDMGKITKEGKINVSGGKIDITESISISQKDIREIQLAVAAVKSGIRMICQKFRLEPKELDKVFIAGAFGNYLNTKNAMRIGLLPKVDPRKIVYIGNSSLAGARALLLSRPIREKMGFLTHKIRYISLATDPRFQEYFIDSLYFTKA